MINLRFAVVISCGVLSLAACGKHSKQPGDPVAMTSPAEAAAAAAGAAPAEAAPATVIAPLPVEAAVPPAAQVERAKKQALLDYSTMEDSYINDPRAQWAAAAKASSTFGEGQPDGPAKSNLAANIVGPVDGENWTNNKQSIGFDWLQAEFEKPVHATEIRVVFHGGEGVEAVNKLEVQDEQGRWKTVWSGLSDVKSDARGDRTWFVKTFDKTEDPVKSVKLTIANNVQAGYKAVDAVQLVGD